MDTTVNENSRQASGFPVLSLPPRAEAFSSRIMGDLSGAVASIMCAIGDRLGLFKDLAARGPSTSQELARRTGINERYAREWLRALTSAGYLDYAPETERFTLPPEHALYLASEGGPMFLGGVFQHLPGLFRPLELVVQAFLQGGGVPQAAYDQDFRAGMERISACWFDNFLVPVWIAALPHVQEKLTRGARVADIGCGGGRALINLALAFPKSTFVGYDCFEPAIASASAAAKQANVDARVKFEQRDALAPLPEAFDLVTAFDVIHDVANPVVVLTSIRRALLPGGAFLMLEINSSDKVEENVGPIATMLYGTSVLYCTPTSIANGGRGLGTMGLPESAVRKLCNQAGFREIERLPFENPFNVLYEIRP